MPITPDTYDSTTDARLRRLEAFQAQAIVYREINATAQRVSQQQYECLDKKLDQLLAEKSKEKGFLGGVVLVSGSVIAILSTFYEKIINLLH